jgi:hypothetical protein
MKNKNYIQLEFELIDDKEAIKRRTNRAYQMILPGLEKYLTGKEVNSENENANKNS